MKREDEIDDLIQLADSFDQYISEVHVIDIDGDETIWGSTYYDGVYDALQWVLGRYNALPHNLADTLQDYAGGEE